MGNRGVAISTSQVVRGPSLAGACRARPSRARPSRARPEIGPVPWEGRGRGIEARAKLCEAQAWREQVVRGQKLGPFHGRVGGVALKPEPSCARPKPGGSKSCEARNWARSMGG